MNLHWCCTTVFKKNSLVLEQYKAQYHTLRSRGQLRFKIFDFEIARTGSTAVAKLNHSELSLEHRLMYVMVYIPGAPWEKFCNCNYPMIVNMKRYVIRAHLIKNMNLVL